MKRGVASRLVRPTGRGRVTIRSARRGDGPAIDLLWRDVDELHARLWPQFFRAEPRSGAAFPSVESDTEVVLVADMEGKVVGVIQAQLFDTPDAPTLVPHRRIHIEDLVVAREVRRHGVGEQLVRAAMSWGKERGAVEVVLVVWEGNQAAARFYKAMGFRSVHRVLGLEI